MEVILLEHVQGIGARGDRIKVAPGYARNFLIPNKLAISAAGAGAKVFAEVQRQLEGRERKEKGVAETLAKSLSGVQVKIDVEVGEEGKLFGSVTSADIAEKLAEQGHTIDKRKIVLEEPIRQLGIYNVPVRLMSDVEGEVKVWVEKKA